MYRHRFPSFDQVILDVPLLVPGLKNNWHTLKHKMRAKQTHLSTKNVRTTTRLRERSSMSRRMKCLSQERIEIVQKSPKILLLFAFFLQLVLLPRFSSPFRLHQAVVNRPGPCG